MDSSEIADMDGPVVRMACNLKCLKDQASILCAVHEAVGLDDLKKMSQVFREDIMETCQFVKKYVLVCFFYLFVGDGFLAVYDDLFITGYL